VEAPDVASIMLITILMGGVPSQFWSLVSLALVAKSTAPLGKLAKAGTTAVPARELCGYMPDCWYTAQENKPQQHLNNGKSWCLTPAAWLAVSNHQHQQRPHICSGSKTMAHTFSKTLFVSFSLIQGFSSAQLSMVFSMASNRSRTLDSTWQ
jgi:hypothetical protein